MLPSLSLLPSPPSGGLLLFLSLPLFLCLPLFISLVPFLASTTSCLRKDFQLQSPGRAPEAPFVGAAAAAARNTPLYFTRD